MVDGLSVAQWLQRVASLLHFYQFHELGKSSVQFMSLGKCHRLCAT